MSKLHEYIRKKEELKRELREYEEKISKVENAARKLAASYNIGEVGYDEYQKKYTETFRDKTPQQWIAHYKIRIKSHRSQIDWYDSQIKKLSRSRKEFDAGLNQRIKTAEDNKQKVISEVQKLAARYSNKEISYAEYQSSISEKFPDKTPQEWVDYYDSYIKNCNRLAEEGRKVAKKQKIKSVGVKFVLPVLLFAFLFVGLMALQKFDLTGFAVQNDKEVHTDILNFVTNESTTYEWNLSNPGKLNWAKVSGKIVGDGNVKIYLDDKLMLDSSNLEESRGRTLTGFASEGAEDSGSDSGSSAGGSSDSSSSGESSGSSGSENAAGSDSGSTSSESTNTDSGSSGSEESSGADGGTGEEGASVGDGGSEEQAGSEEGSVGPGSSVGGEESGSDSTGDNEQSSENETSNEPVNQTQTETNQTGVPESGNETSNETGVANETSSEGTGGFAGGTSFSFEEHCEETCDLSELGLNKSSYTLRIEVAGSEVRLDSIKYEIEKTGEELLPENITAEELILNRTTKQYKAVINRPVKWVTALNVTNKTDENQTKVKIPKESTNISVKTGDEAKTALAEAEDSDEDVKNTDRKELAKSAITGNVVLGPQEGGLFSRVKGLFSKGSITGDVIQEALPENVVETEDAKVVDLEPVLSETADTEVAVEYFTDAPVATEKLTPSGKTVKVSAADELNYTDILAFAEVPEVVSVEDASKIKIYWEEESKFIDYDVYDLNNNGYVDYVEWVVPHLSNQTFNIILITKAEHLDENREVISDIYNATFARDDVWSEAISDGEYVRVTFEHNLTDGRDITLFPRTVNGTPRIEVYEVNGTELVAEFESLDDNVYNKVYLTGFNGSQDVFDLKVLDGSIELDHIIDPAGNTLTSDGSCGSNCNYATSTYEPAGDNTIDSCADGASAANAINSCQYMWIQDIFIDNLNSSTQFATGDTINVTCDIKCWSTGTEYAISYNNGSGWQVVSYGNCPSGPSYSNTGGPSCPNNRVNISTTKVLNSVVGTHAFRCQESWVMGANDAERICDSSDSYHDADDINLTVVSPSDTTAPIVFFNSSTTSSGTQTDTNIYVAMNSSDTFEHYSFLDFNNDVVLWMRMDDVNGTGDPTDLSIYSTNGTKINQANQSSAGKFGKSFYFDGVGDKIVVSDASKLAFGYQNFTLSAWFNSTDLANTNEGVLGKWGGASYYYCSVWSSDDKLRCYLNFGSGNTGPISTSALTPNTWYHMVFVVNRNGYATLYLNGAAQSGAVDISASSGIAMTGGQFAIGGIGNDISSFDFTGQIDDVVIFNRTLSQSEISALYNSSVNQYSRNFTGLSVGTYNFTGHAVDSSANKNQTETRSVTIFSDTTAPSISFIAPTPFDLSYRNSTDIYVNLSTSDVSDHYSFLDFNNDVVLWMRMDDLNASGQPVDLSPHGNNGTLVGDAAQTNSGKFGKGFAFDGNLDYIKIPHSSSLNLSTHSTVSTWVKLTGPISYYDSIIMKDTNGGWGHGYGMWFQNSTTLCYFFGAYSESLSYCDLTFNSSQWNHVVMSVNSTNALLYVNGVLKQTIPASFVDSGSTNLYIGSGTCDATSGCYTINGTVDDVLIFNRTLDQQEIYSLYNASSNRYYKNFTGLSVGTHNFTGYTVDAYANKNQTSTRIVKIDQTNPLISYGSGTTADSSSQTYNNVYVNLSTSDSGSPYAFTDFDNDLLLWMRFDDLNGSGQPIDLSSYSHNGTLAGDAKVLDSGAFGDSLALDGSGDYVELGTQPELYSPKSTVTVSAWIYPTSAEPYQASVLNTQNYLLRNYYAASQIQFAVYSDPAHIEGTAVATYTPNQWNHIVGVYNGTHVQIYRDGVLQSSNYFGYNISTSSGVSRIGTSTSQYWNGSIDDVMIFNRSLSAQEISALYNSTANQSYNNFTGLGYGVHNFTGHVVDKAGNKNQTSARTVTISAPDFDAPSIFFGDGTTTSGTSQTNNTLYVNISSSDASNHYTLLDIGEDLILWTKFENDFNDSSTHGFDGVIDTGSPTFDVGTFGNATTMNSDSSIHFPDLDNASAINDSGNFSVGFWIKTNDDVAGAVIADYGTVETGEPPFTSTENYGWIIQVSSTLSTFGNIEFKAYAGQTLSSLNVIGTTDISDGTWHHVVVEHRSDGQIYLYVDGVYDSNEFRGTIGQNNNRTFTIGSAGGSNNFNGSIDDLVVFDRALDDAEVAALYSSSANQYVTNVTGLADGTYNFTGYAVDEGGYMNQTETRNVTINVNDAPEVITVWPIANQDPTEDGMTSVNFTVTARDIDGVDDISSVILDNVSRSGETLRGAGNVCTFNVGEKTDTTANYTCSVNMWYFDGAGAWNISVSATDYSAATGRNTSSYFTYNLLKSMALSPASITWSGVSAGAVNQTAANDPVTINNTGNANISNISLTGIDLHGNVHPEYTIGVGNISVDTDTGSSAECVGGTNLVNGTSVNITSATLSKGNHSVNDGSTGQEQLYYCIQTVPSALPTQTYSTDYGGAWKITIFVVAFASRRKKKKKNRKAIESFLESKFGFGINALFEIAERVKRIALPVEIFTQGLSPAEAVAKYMKENLGMSYHDIALALNRDERTIWVNYRNAIKSMPERLSVSGAGERLPGDILSDRRLSISESVVLYMRSKGMKNAEIAEKLCRDPRNVFTLYSRARVKLQEKGALSQFEEIEDALQKEFGLSIEEVRELEEHEVQIPLAVFTQGLSPAEAVAKYMKENLEMSYHDIALALNRDERTIWVNYRNALSRKKVFGDLLSRPEVPVELLRDRQLSVYESAVLYLRKKGLTNAQIAIALHKDPRNVFTVYSRAVKKMDKKTYKV